MAHLRSAALLPFPQGRVTSQAQPSAFALSCLIEAIKLVGVTVSLPALMNHRHTHKHTVAGGHRDSALIKSRRPRSRLHRQQLRLPIQRRNYSLPGVPRKEISHFYCVNSCEGGSEAAASTSWAHQPASRPARRRVETANHGINSLPAWCHGPFH